MLPGGEINTVLITLENIKESNISLTDDENLYNSSLNSYQFICIRCEQYLS